MTIGFRVGSARFAALGAVALWGVSFVATKAAPGAARHPVGAREATPAALPRGCGWGGGWVGPPRGAAGGSSGVPRAPGRAPPPPTNPNHPKGGDGPTR